MNTTYITQEEVLQYASLSALGDAESRARQEALNALRCSGHPAFATKQVRRYPTPEMPGEIYPILVTYDTEDGFSYELVDEL